MKFISLLLLLSLLFGFSPILSVVHGQFVVPISGLSSIFSNDVTADAAGNAYLTGSFIGTADFDGGPGQMILTSVGLKDVFISKYDDTGALVWAFNVGGIGGGPGLDDEGLALTVSSEGHLYVTGYFQGTADFDPGPETTLLTSAGFRDAFIVSYTSDGEFRWARSFGGIADDRGQGVATQNERVYITGDFQEEGAFGPEGASAIKLNSLGLEDGFVAAFDDVGAVTNAFQFGSSAVDGGRDLGIDAAGNLYLLGAFSGAVDFNPDSAENILNSVNGSLDVVLASYTPAGDYRWAIHTGGAQIDEGNGLAVDAAGNSFVIGHFIGKSDFDPGPDEAERVSVGARDQFIASYDQEGGYRWVTQAGNGFAEGEDITLGPDGNLVAGSVFSGDIFPDEASALRITSQGDQDILLAGYTADGGFRWATGVGGSLAQVASGVAVDIENRVLLTGYFEAETDFDPSDNVQEVSSQGVFDAFLVRFDGAGQLPVAIEPLPGEIMQAIDMEVYPNPARSQAQVILAVSEPHLLRLEVIDALGRSVRKIDDIPGVTDAQLTISMDLSDLSAGLYMVRATSRSGVQVHPFVVAR